MRRGDCRGSVALELVILVPAVLAMLMLVIYGGRVVSAQSQVQSAASAAARAASMQGSLGGAGDVVGEVAQENMADSGLSCGPGSNAVIVNESTDFRPGGQVTVRATCIADLSSLAFIGAPGSLTINRDATEVIDDLRGEGG